jgi:hypothetical protein
MTAYQLCPTCNSRVPVDSTTEGTHAFRPVNFETLQSDLVALRASLADANAQVRHLAELVRERDQLRAHLFESTNHIDTLAARLESLALTARALFTDNTYLATDVALVAALAQCGYPLEKDDEQE